MMAHPLKGKKQSPEHIAARVAARRANDTYHAGVPQLIERNKARVGENHSDEHKAKVSAAMMGKSTAWLKGLKRPIEFRQKLSDYYLANPEKHNHYIDGKGVERCGERNQAISRLDYRLWREAIFKRDNWTCVECWTRGGELHADHIKTWANFPDLRYDIANGRTLCAGCHRKTPTYGKSGKLLAAIEGLADAAD